MRPALSNAIDMQSRPRDVENVSGNCPMGPFPQYVSVIHESLWTLLRPFFAMNGCFGGLSILSGFAVPGAPLYAGSEVAVPPLAIGAADGAAAARTSADAAIRIAAHGTRTDRGFLMASNLLPAVGPLAPTSVTARVNS